MVKNEREERTAMNDTQITEHQPSQAERLEGLLYLYNQLHNALVENKEILIKNTTHHAELLKDFKAQIANFEQLETGVKDRLVKSLEEATRDIITAMNKKISEAATNKVDKILKSLEKLTQDANTVFESQYRENTSQLWKFLLCAIMTGAAVGVLSAYLLTKNSTVSLPEEDMMTYHAGQFMQTLWPKLSKQEQQRLKDIESGKIKNHPHSHATQDNTEGSDTNE